MVIKIPRLHRASVNHEPEHIIQALDYIKGQWQQLEHYSPEDTGTLIGLPYRYIVPATPHKMFSFEEQYYWDSYFTAVGYNGPDRQVIVEGMLENLIFLLRRFGMIPTANRMYFTGRSQPPILTSYIFYVYDNFDKSEQWLREHIALAQKEYREVWMSDHHPHWRNINGLNRYYDINALHDLAEAESGWDMTPRFERKCLDYLPIDLNALLFKYEMDFSRAAEILGDDVSKLSWDLAAAARRAQVDELMWSVSKQMYFDYNYVTEFRSSAWSLAAYYPLWVGMASPEQAAGLVRNLSKFRQTGGLTATTRPLIDMSIFGSVKTQWAFPNGWAPLHFIVTEGLERYGYVTEAAEIAHSWLGTNLHWFERQGTFVEKYNVVNPAKSSADGVYPGQAGFAWTNAVFAYYAQKYYGVA